MYKFGRFKSIIFIYLEYTDEDFAHDAETSRQLKRKQAQAA
jgi:hypothetical protein